MARLVCVVLALCFSVAGRAVASDSSAVSGTAVGWFACDRCATPRVKAGHVGPTNRDCSQKCIADGAKIVFIDERAAAVFEVANPDAAKGQEGHYVQITGTTDASAKTVHVASVTVLKSYVAKCARPKVKD